MRYLISVARAIIWSARQPYTAAHQYLFVVTMKKMGVDVTLVDPDAPEEEIEKAIRPNTKCVSR